MTLTCSRHKAAAVNRRPDSFQSLTLSCLAMDRGDRKVNSLIAALSSGDKLCTCDVGIYCSSQPTISPCLFWMGNGSSCQRRAKGNRELIPANMAYAAVGAKDRAGNTVQNRIPLQWQYGMPHALFPWSTTSSLIRSSINTMSLCTAIPFCFNFRTSLYFFCSLSLLPYLYHKLSTSLFWVSACFQFWWNSFDHTSLPSQQLLTPHFRPSLALLLWTVVWSALWWAVWGRKCFNIRAGRLAGGWLKYTNSAMTNMKCSCQVYIEIPNTLTQNLTLSLILWNVGLL